MAWIHTVSESEANGELKAIYDAQRRAAGAVAEILKVHSLRPDVLRAHLELYITTMHKPGALSAKHREMIAVAVSSLNGCHY